MKVEKKELKMVETVIGHVYICDKCGKELLFGHAPVASVSVKLSIPKTYPGSEASLIKSGMDLCMNCEGKMLDVLREYGFNVTTQTFALPARKSSGRD